MIVGNVKRCNKCGDWKTFEEFFKGRATCNACIYFQRNEWMKANPQKRKTYYDQAKPQSSKRQKQFRETIEGKAKALCLAASQRARQSKLEFNLTWHVIFVLLHSQNFKCAQTGIAFEFSTIGTHRKLRKLTAPSIDRKNNDEGYTVDNIQVVCWFYNAAKGTATDQEIWLLFNSMRMRVF